jgi:putative transposase
VRTGHGPLEVEVPRDREGSFEPQLIPKHQRHFDGFDDKIHSMYARGMSTREIRDHLQEIYGIEVSPDLISRVIDSVLEELAAWQSRPLERVYLVAYLDALVVKVRDKSGVRSAALFDSLRALEGPQERVRGAQSRLHRIYFEGRIPE